MKILDTELKEVKIIQPKVFDDERGYFFETFREDILENYLGYKIDFCQENESKSSKGVLRGLHYQLTPYAQTKLVRVIYGKVLDVAVDIRRGSETFGRHVAVELSMQNKKQLLVPRGFAHGFVVLSDEAVFVYKVDNYYNKESERGIIFDDKTLQIDWKLDTEKLILSKKDLIQPEISKADIFDIGERLYS